jgi:nicotinamide-nucleotide amidase
MTAEIITIGDELLIGQVVDTNSAWLAEQLNLIGIKVKQITSVSDEESHILSSLDEASSRAELILMTGGLGPTKDDITKHTLCKYFETKLVFNNDVYKHVESFFKIRNLPMIERNRQQAELPENCTIVPNVIGTAPGMWFTKNGKHYISMPGVPFEMKEMAKNSLFPMLKAKFKLPVIIHRTILLFGIGESFLAEKIKDWENNLPSQIKLAYLPSPEHIRLRMSISGNDEKPMHQILAREEDKLQNIIGEYIFGYDKQGLPETIAELFKNSGKTLSTAESCTGGKIAQLLTALPGSSAYYKGSIIAYSNEIKESILSVNTLDLNKFGAVSEVVVKQMAIGARNLFKTDFAIATTGIAGPDGGTPEKPVGTVWIATASQNKVFASKYTFGNMRDINIRRSSAMALFMLRKHIMQELLQV